MEKLNLETKNLAKDKFIKLAELFPNAITETIVGQDEEGNDIIDRAIDADILRQEIAEHVIEGREERYEFTWPDKRKSMLLANAPINKTLRPIREDSLKFDETENLYIEGDNLDVLKLLRETYLGKVKMIYIDPPYNTGNDFVYEDDFTQNMEDYKEVSGDFDEEGNRLFKNTDSNGRFHTDWLNMMYPRLKLARDLLSDDGVIFISIDDNEVENLKKMCNEIFGADNFINQLVIESGEVFGQKSAHADKTFIKVKDYILAYGRENIRLKNKNPLYTALNNVYDSHYNTILDNELNRCTLKEYLIKNDKLNEKFIAYKLDINEKNINKLINLDSEFKDIFITEISHKLYQDQPYSQKLSKEILKKIKENDIIKYKDLYLFSTKTGSIRYYKPFTDAMKLTDDYLPVLTRATVRGDLWKGFHYDMRNITKEGNIKFQNGKKPKRLIKQLIKWMNTEDDIILDFFAGSSTTAHAVMELNAEDNVKRKYIMVQLAEDLDENYRKSTGDTKKLIKENIKLLESINKPHYLTEIGKERIRRSIREIKKDYPDSKFDDGFRVLRVDSSNMKDVYHKPEDYSQSLLDKMESNIKEDRNEEDLLFQVMLSLGIDLSSKIQKEKINENKVLIVEDGFLISCFDEEITEGTVESIAKKQPYYAVFSEGKMSDSTLANFEQIFDTYSPTTIRRVI